LLFCPADHGWDGGPFQTQRLGRTSTTKPTSL
jgi:hypothetical protein